MSRQADRRPILASVLESNERRFEALDRQGVRVALDGRAVLQYLFDRALTTRTPREFRLNWALDVAGLLNEAEAAEAHARRTARHR